MRFLCLRNVNNNNNCNLGVPTHDCMTKHVCTLSQEIYKSYFMLSPSRQWEGKYYSNQAGKYYYSRFIDDKTEAQRGQETCPAS